ncbi:MAG: hypothetical protein PHV34_20395 [Verrucomicrobiae bacterium]|nr:hypothetical protein [Verrucomicrobiae bacterium]
MPKFVVYSTRQPALSKGGFLKDKFVKKALRLAGIRNQYKWMQKYTPLQRHLWSKKAAIIKNARLTPEERIQHAKLMASKRWGQKKKNEKPSSSNLGTGNHCLGNSVVDKNVFAVDSAPFLQKK